MTKIIDELKNIYSVTDELGVGFYSKFDWDRLDYVSSLPFKGRVLDVGCGNGTLLHMLKIKKEELELTGIEVRKHSKLILPFACDYQIADLRTPIKFPNPYDFVICMEVLEHLEVIDLNQALANLRHAYSKILLCTVPLNEPEPVWWHDRLGGHRQSFSFEKIATLFPNAMLTVIKNYKVDWMMIAEGNGIARGVTLVENSEFAKRIDDFARL
jgi:SAM-dependent methyltransferase